MLTNGCQEDDLQPEKIEINHSQILERAKEIVDDLNVNMSPDWQKQKSNGLEVSHSSDLVIDEQFHARWGVPYYGNKGEVVYDGHNLVIIPLILENERVDHILVGYDDDDEADFRIIHRNRTLTERTYNHTPLDSYVISLFDAFEQSILGVTGASTSDLTTSSDSDLTATISSYFCGDCDDSDGFTIPGTYEPYTTECEGKTWWCWRAVNESYDDGNDSGSGGSSGGGSSGTGSGSDPGGGDTGDGGPSDGGGGDSTGGGGGYTPPETTNPECLSSDPEGFENPTEPDDPGCVDDTDEEWACFNGENFGCCRYTLEGCGIEEMDYTCVEENLWNRLGSNNLFKDYLRNNDWVVDTLGNFFARNSSSPQFLCTIENPDLKDAAFDYLSCQVFNNGDCQDILDNPDCNLDADEFELAFPDTDEERVDSLVKFINRYGRKFGVNTSEEMKHFLAQTGYESRPPGTSDEFMTFEESFRYRINRLGVIYWNRYFNPLSNPTANPNKANPNDYRSEPGSNWVDPEPFANYVYDDANRPPRYRLGNTQAGDGWRFRGRGIKQLTGRDNYQEFSDYFRDEWDDEVSIVDNPDLLSDVDSIAIISALWYYENHVLSDLDIDENTTVAQVTIEVQGSDDSAAERQLVYNRVNAHINCYK